jgi:hypothetical protein
MTMALLVVVFLTGCALAATVAAALHYRKDAERERETGRQIYDLVNCVVGAVDRNTETMQQLLAAFSGEIPPAIETIRQFSKAMPPWLRRLEHLEKRMREYNDVGGGE